MSSAGTSEEAEAAGRHSPRQEGRTRTASARRLRRFFFSSRRRHTRWPRDWSSDVCSSDLDCVASVRRWAARAAAGQTMMQRVKDTPVADDKTFRIVLSEPYGLVIDSLSTISTSLCYMMRKKDAETDPNQQVRETVGSGPFLYNRDETRPGNRHVYDRNPNYFPRKEAPSAMAGGKVVK